MKGYSISKLVYFRSLASNLDLRSIDFSKTGLLGAVDTHIKLVRRNSSCTLLDLLFGFLDPDRGTEIAPLGHPFLELRIFSSFLHPPQNCICSLHLIDVLWRRLTSPI